jgi:hypothetical protein
MSDGGSDLADHATAVEVEAGRAEPQYEAHDDLMDDRFVKVVRRRVGRGGWCGARSGGRTPRRPAAWGTVGAPGREAQFAAHGGAALSQWWLRRSSSGRAGTAPLQRPETPRCPDRPPASMNSYTPTALSSRLPRARDGIPGVKGRCAARQSSSDSSLMSHPRPLPPVGSQLWSVSH